MSFYFIYSCTPHKQLSVDLQSQVSHEVVPAVVGKHNVSATERYSSQCKIFFQNRIVLYCIVLYRDCCN